MKPKLSAPCLNFRILSELAFKMEDMMIFDEKIKESKVNAVNIYISRQEFGENILDLKHVRMVCLK